MATEPSLAIRLIDHILRWLFCATLPLPTQAEHDAGLDAWLEHHDL